MFKAKIGAVGLALLMAGQAVAQQTSPGAGNGDAVKIAQKSALVQDAMDFLTKRAKSLSDTTLRNETLDAITNAGTCVRHRAGFTNDIKSSIIQSLIDQGLVNVNDGTNFPGGLTAGIFPPVLQETTSCPQLPQPFFSAPGSVFHGHHSYPGGLPIHESNNDTADINLATEYRAVYGQSDHGLPVIRPVPDEALPVLPRLGFVIDDDLIVGAPIWHDWGKPIVFQWNSDGSEFLELNFGGNGTTDNYGAAGDSRTGAHHIIGVAEAMKRGLSPAFVITQASAHSTPSSGNEYKVVNWLRAAALIAQIDPVATGYLTKDSHGKLRLPALRDLGQINFLETTPSQTNILVEYELHNLSDADFTFSGPAVTMVETILAQLGPEFGFDPANATSYNLGYRNPVLSSLTAERLQIVYANQGLDGVRSQLQVLRDAGGF